MPRNVSYQNFNRNLNGTIHHTVSPIPNCPFIQRLNHCPIQLIMFPSKVSFIQNFFPVFGCSFVTRCCIVWTARWWAWWRCWASPATHSSCQCGSSWLLRLSPPGNWSVDRAGKGISKLLEEMLSNKKMLILTSPRRVRFKLDVKFEVLVER